MPAELNLIIPQWPAPAHVQAAISCRQGGVSAPPYHSLNLADHVGDNPQHLAENRRILRHALQLPAEPLWLNQVHGTQLAQTASASPGCSADASIASQPHQICAVLTADCLPLLVTNQQGTHVAAIHAGWRGLAGGIIEATLRQFPPSDPLLLWLGPAIGPQAFEVGPEVRQHFIRLHPADRSAFTPSPQGRWLADLYQLARRRIQYFNVGYIGGGHYCTYSEPQHFYSYRREPISGRMASLVWIN